VRILLNRDRLLGNRHCPRSCRCAGVRRDAQRHRARLIAGCGALDRDPWCGARGRPGTARQRVYRHRDRATVGRNRCACRRHAEAARRSFLCQRHVDVIHVDRRLARRRVRVWADAVCHGSAALTARRRNERDPTRGRCCFPRAVTGGGNGEGTRYPARWCGAGVAAVDRYLALRTGRRCRRNGG